MEKPIRILQVLGGLDRGGAETLVMNLYRNIDRTEIQFDFIIHTLKKGDYAEEIESLGGIIFYCPSYRGKNHFSYRKWWKAFFLQHPEYKVLHSHVRSCASLYLPIAKKYGLKTIIHSHNTSEGKGVSALVKRILQIPLRYQADYLFACSGIAGRWLYGKKALKKEKYVLFPNAIDLAQYCFHTETRDSFRKQLLIQEEPVWIHVGRFTEQKNHSFLLEVFSEIVKIRPTAKLVLVGDGPLRDKIEEKIDRLDLQKNVLLLGVRKDVAGLLQAADGFLFPSKWEGFPVTVVEAQAVGLPCLISDTITKEAALSEAVRQKSLRQSPADWAKEALDQLGKRYDTREELIKEGFEIHASAEKLAAFYEKLANE